MKEKNNEQNLAVVGYSTDEPGMNADAVTNDALQSVRDGLAHLVAHASAVQAARKALVQAEQLAAGHLGDWTVRFMLLQLKEAAGHTVQMFEQWSELLPEQPDNLRIVRYCATHLVREHRDAEALALIDQYMPETLGDHRAGLARAELLADIRAFAPSDALYRKLIELHGRRELRVAFAKRLAKRGLLADAVETLAPVAATLAPETKAGQLAASLAKDYAFFRRFESEDGLAGRDIKIVSMKHAILAFRDRVIVEPDAQSAPSIALLTGSLGPGGAERQLTRLACNLQRLSKLSADAERGPEDVAITRPKAVEVLVKQYTDQGGTGKHRMDFFAGNLHEAGVPLTEINALPAVAVSHQPVDDPDLRHLLEMLPAPVHYGVTRLAPRLRERGFDVVSLWQDGTCLFGALAALLAGVPVIHLTFRGLPPSIRKERDRPEYEVLYRALAQVPGVQFVSNSRTAAEEYARWLDLPLTRFQILYNGVPDLDTHAPGDEQARWQAFAEATPDATETIGGVFRFEPDKRPLLFIKLAARYLKRRPHARFMIVGDGRLQDKAVELAAELGVAQRLLFVGLSSHVGFWYSKMDAKVLLSRYEGLPNVLIEAQLLGIATLSTPAGGAGECFVDGVTGHLLDCAEQPDLNAACDKLAVLIDGFQADDALREHARHRARMLFSVDAMIERFSALCAPVEIVAADEADYHDLAEKPLPA
ncbi:group 1 glycosyl transferase [Caballeronia pedi]|uniref:Group 1 glycosyl transferase n=1 Tax=Caballeronia pedi TaxID=1777141 RepID=A0A158CZ80_9BURK|nr:glycosyltransferase [Caballeronia pedi]SAK87643.1 group 1 glycosyl transferase [Caballeronia pedi]